MTHRPHVFAVQSTDDRALAVALISQASVTGVEIDHTGDFDRPGRRLRQFHPGPAQDRARLRHPGTPLLLPSDKSPLESVFSYLVEA